MRTTRQILQLLQGPLVVAWRRAWKPLASLHEDLGTIPTSAEFDAKGRQYISMQMYLKSQWRDGHVDVTPCETISLLSISWYIKSSS
ncbi:hypothetical protein AAFF_G00236910 [Aldrovandia affinis]|uniref:Uncharacterized protein n=1 Tax=Aldrovandia affinis TaxID=143900 RepID=A0AAD7W465_9TELE|nr:hypothetical protein AAFF_G00236910 [Aldrovandia affinis]